MAELLDVARSIAAQAEPGEQLEAYVAEGRETSIRVFEGAVETLSSSASAGVGVRVVSGNRVGFAWVAALDEASAREALAEARDNARYSSADEFAGLALPDGVEPAELDLWRDELAETPTEAKVELALELERLVKAGDSRMTHVPYADYDDAMSSSAIATSTGIESSSRRSTCSVFGMGVASDGDDTQTGAGYAVGRCAEDLDVAKAAGDSVDRATRLLGAKKPSSARLTVVLERRMTATLLSILAGTLSGDEVSKGRSLFANRAGEEVATPNFTLVDDPTNPLAWGAARTDAEGLACRRNSLIEGGKLLGFLYDTRSAQQAGTVSTASAVRGGYRTTPGVGARAIAIEPGELDEDEVVSRIPYGLLVQSMSGVHSGVNPISGDFSVGAEGVMIRDGALAEPVREMTIASSIQRMLQHVLFVGSDLEYLPGSAAGVTLAIDDMAMSGA
ncbi:MAG: TldD/PmbA family protein [Acidimicrobiales bacterium]